MTGLRRDCDLGTNDDIVLGDGFSMVFVAAPSVWNCVERIRDDVVRVVVVGRVVSVVHCRPVGQQADVVQRRLVWSRLARYYHHLLLHLDESAV